MPFNAARWSARCWDWLCLASIFEHLSLLNMQQLVIITSRLMGSSRHRTGAGDREMHHWYHSWQQGNHIPVSQLPGRMQVRWPWHGTRYILDSIAIETLGVFNASACQLLAVVGRRISINSSEATETSYLFHFGAALQCCFVAWQFAGRWLHRLKIIPTFVLLSQFFW